MLKWLHHLLNPHCPDCEAEHICKSCEFLKHENERLVKYNEQLLDRLLEKPKVTQEIPFKIDPTILKSQSKNIPWSVRRQMLETESREAAKIKAQYKAENPTEIDELEHELDLVQTERENAG